MQLFKNNIFGPSMHPLDLAKQIALLISHEEMDDIIEVVRSLKDAGL